MSETAEKICVLCGSDCATRPRVKDDRGRYYCKSCHEAALKRQGMAAHDKLARDDDSAPSSQPAQISTGFGTGARPQRPAYNENSDELVPLFDDDKHEHGSGRLIDPSDMSDTSDSFAGLDVGAGTDSAERDPLGDLASAIDGDDDDSHIGERCPKCNGPINAGAVLCINCGCDLQTGSQMNIEMEDSDAPD